MSLATQIKAILRKDGLSDIEFSLSGGAITVLSATSLDLRIEDGLKTFSRTLKQMKAIGINVNEDKIRLKDAYALCHFCDSHTASLCLKHHDNCDKCPLN